jgi:tungstate transport system ATP-binding protein
MEPDTAEALMSFIETKDVYQKRDGRDILKNINIGIDRGQVLALIGPTGAGKTTLLRVIDMLDKPSSGRVFFDGTDVTSSEKARLAARRRMAFVLQKPVVFNTSVYENVAYGLRWRGMDRRQTREEADAILETVGMAAYGKRHARTLSGGEVQRIAFARALATGPEVLLLDEPTANLDPVSASKIEDLVWRIIKRDAITVVMATHDMSQGQRLADRIGVLVNGEIVQTGGAREVFTSPRDREVAEFVGMENIIDGVVVSSENGMVTIDIKGTLIEAVADFKVGESVLVCIRPEDITIALSRLSSSARNCLVGTINYTAFDGPLCRIEIDCGFPLVALLTRKSAEELELKTGKQVYATFKAVSIHIIRRH